MSTVKLFPFSAPAPCIERFSFRVFSGVTPVPGLFLWIVCVADILDRILDSDNAATTPLAGKIRRCSCRRRMSSLAHDFHSICVVCRGVDCDTDLRCPKCKDVGDLVMTKYVTHKLSLQSESQSKRSKKDPVPAPVVVADVAVSEPPSSLVPPSVTSVSPVPVDDSSQVSGVRGEILSRIKSLFDSFT